MIQGCKIAGATEKDEKKQEESFIRGQRPLAVWGRGGIKGIARGTMVCGLIIPGAGSGGKESSISEDARKRLRRGRVWTEKVEKEDD